MEFKRVRDLREDNDYSQREIAKILCIGQTSYSEYETGKREMPISIAIALAKFHNVSLDYLAGLTKIESEFPKK